MFEPQIGPNVFGVAPGQDFSRTLITGLWDRMAERAPEDWARIEIYVNTRRMQRRLLDLMGEERAMLLPKVRLITDLAQDHRFPDIPPVVSSLRRRLEVSQLVTALLDREPDLAPRAALFDLSDSLASLMEEMEGEGVAADAISAIDVSDQSGHWQRSLKFVDLVQSYVFERNGLSSESRLRRVVDRLADNWTKKPPEHPILIAGSTGSRGATFRLMKAVASLPMGAVILPGVDFDMPAEIWDRLDDPMTSQDHPQYRFSNFTRALELHPSRISQWADPSVENGRNKLMSLALRPAPVTDQWMEEGQRLTNLADATRGLTLIEAPSPRAEAVAISIALREAVADGKVTALITPDRNLTRRVTASLDRWGIVPDDSAGRPLAQSAPGRFLRQVSSLFQQKLTIETLLALLKHPLTHSAGEDRGEHLLETRELELFLRRKGRAYPKCDDINAWAADGEVRRIVWSNWLKSCIAMFDVAGILPLSDHVARHIELAERLARGSGEQGSGALWEMAAGEEALKTVSELRDEAEAGGTMSMGEYNALFAGILNSAEVREAQVAHPRVMIWGTLEARVQGADLLILGGLNEGVWPGTPQPDPWLNRRMRAEVGLLQPDRQIGLSAHDFQQAVAADQVILTRAVRDDEAETVPSRWVNRLSNLLKGLSGESQASLKAMQMRGTRYLRLAETLEVVTVEPAAARPAPRPPISARPKEISVTEVQKLIRDPYAVYARRVLGLEPLAPMRIAPDAPLRGTLVHRVLERFTDTGPFASLDEGKRRLLSFADEIFERDVPWPATRAVWRSHLESVADWFLEGELQRGAIGAPVATESRGALFLDEPGVSLVGRPDRVDRLATGEYAVYDYKTGKPSSTKQRENFDKQLPLTAALVERGALAGIRAGDVTEVGYIALTKKPVFETSPLESGEIDRVLAELVTLLKAYQDPAGGYVSRRAIERREQVGDYDHLARFGEWDEADTPNPEDVGQ